MARRPRGQWNHLRLLSCGSSDHSTLAADADLIGVVLPGFANHFYGELAEALRTAGEERGYVPLLASIAEDPGREVSAIEQFLELRACGLILVSPRRTESAEVIVPARLEQRDSSRGVDRVR